MSLHTLKITALPHPARLGTYRYITGDVLFQHANLLHTSDPNESDMRRWAFVACYNRASNDSFIPHHHANYIPLEKVRFPWALQSTAVYELRVYFIFSKNMTFEIYSIKHVHSLIW